MRVLVFGQTGQVARELSRQAEVIALGRGEADLSNPESCVAAITARAPAAVINAAAYTAVDRAEEEEELATVINGTTPGAIANACADCDIPFVHLSTDYVFDGSGDASWRPDNHTAPVSAYGRSKLAGERRVAIAGGRHAILRTSWVFSPYGQNFVKTMLRLGGERDELRVVADQIGGPTSAAAIARACLAIVSQLAENPNKTGIYHFAGTPDISWAGFARATFELAGLACRVEDVGTANYPTPARRPANSRLDCSTTEATFGLARPDWQAELKKVLQELRQKKEEQ